MSIATTHHQSTFSLVSIIGSLRKHGGWMRTGPLATQSDVARDSCLRILYELERHGWVTLREHEGARWWHLGPELPRIGIDYQRRLTAEAVAIREQYDAAMAPFPETP